MFLGRTGAGKSTLVNALMGHKLKWETIEIPPTENALRRSRKLGIPLKKQTEKKLNLVLNRNIASFAEVGHGAVSETTYPACYSIDEEDYMSCDCPGLGDTRGTAKEFCVALSTRVAIEQAQHVQAVVFVIPYASIQKDRSIASGVFRPAIAMLNNLFPEGFERHKKSIFFVFTKAPKKTTALDCLNLLEWHLLEGAEGAYADILKALTELDIRSLVFDPVDERVSLEKIRKALNESKPISSSVFGFPGENKVQGALSAVFSKKAREAVMWLKHLGVDDEYKGPCPQHSEKLNGELQKIKKQHSKIKAEIKKLKKTVFDQKENEKQISGLKTKLITIARKLKRVRSQKDNNQERQMSLQGEIAKLSAGETELAWRSNLFKPGWRSESCGFLWLDTETTYHYQTIKIKYDGKPFTRIKKERNSKYGKGDNWTNPKGSCTGTWKNEVSEPEAGRYSVDFRTNDYGSVRVKFYADNTVYYADRISQKEDAIETLKKD